MSATSTFRGRKIEYRLGKWIYADTGNPIKACVKSHKRK